MRPTVPPTPRTGVVITRRIASILLSVLALILGFLLAALAFVALIKVCNLAITSALSLLVLFAATWILTALAHKLWAPRRRKPEQEAPSRPALPRRKAPYLVAAASTAAIGAVAGAVLLAPLPQGERPAAAPADTQYWDLPTGSHIAYWEYQADTAAADAAPIVFIHGGPGAYVRDFDRDFFATLTGTGHDVYLYDQPGGGYSTDLPASEYTLDRTLADLEAIRTEIGAKKLVLIGQSAGGYIAEAYAVAHPEHVERVVLTSPGGYQQETESEPGPEPDQSDQDDTEGGTMASPRLVGAIALMSAGYPEGAEHLVSQEEIKAYAELELDSVIAACFPPSWQDKVPDVDGGGINFYANLGLTTGFEQTARASLDAIGALHIPTLLIRPEYDYVPWPDQRAYRDANPDTEVVYVEEAGHISWVPQPAAIHDAIAAFLADQPQPAGLYTGDEDPKLAGAVGAGTE